MAWLDPSQRSELPAPDIHALVALIAREPGVVARCPCGAACFCPLTPSGLDAYNQFDKLHAACLRVPA